MDGLGGATLAGGGAGLPWTFGHGFARGAVPSGTHVAVSGVSAYQVEVRNRWSDGSMKFAVISGVGGASATLGVSNAPPPSGEVGPVTSADVGDTRLEASGIGTVRLADAISGADLGRFAGAKGTRPAAAGRLRVQFAGPVMREEHFYSPLGTYMAVFWYVRKYSTGHVEVETVVENGWQYVTGGAETSYVASLVVNGTERYNSGTAIAHICRTRWSRADWVGAAPGVTALPSAGHLRASRLVPNYVGYDVPTVAALEAMGQDATPFARNNFRTSMGDPGYGASIGLLPSWDAMYVSSGGDTRAFRSVVVHARSAGRYAMWFRNEATLALDFNSAEPQAHVSDNGGRAVFSSVTGGNPPAWSASHHPSLGYMAYLLTGRWAFLETIVGAATGGYFRHAWLSRRDGVRGLEYFGSTARVMAWNWRTLGQAAAIAPDGSAVKAEAQHRFGENMMAFGKYWTGVAGHGIKESSSAYRTDEATAPNALGCVSFMDPYLEDQLWMHHFVTQALGHTWDIEPLGEGEHRRWHQTLRDKSYDIVGAFALPPANNYRFGLSYRARFGSGAPGVRNWFPNWRAAVDATLAGDEYYEALRNDASLGGELYSTGEDAHADRIDDSRWSWSGDQTHLLTRHVLASWPQRLKGRVTAVEYAGGRSTLTIAWLTSAPTEANTPIRPVLPFEAVSTRAFYAGYAANAQPAIAFARDHGHPLGAEAWRLFSRSRSYIDGVASYRDAPQFGVAPR